MDTILSWLIAAGVVAVLGGLAYLYFRFLRGSTSVVKGMKVGGTLVKAVASMLPDDADKLDAHDVVLVLGKLLEELPKWAEDPSNAEFLDVKDEVLVFIELQRGTIPQLADLDKDVLAKVAEALFMLTKALMSLGK